MAVTQPNLASRRMERHWRYCRATPGYRCAQASTQQPITTSATTTATERKKGPQTQKGPEMSIPLSRNRRSGPSGGRARMTVKTYHKAICNTVHHGSAVCSLSPPFVFTYAVAGVTRSNACHTCTVLSAPAEAMHVPSGDQAIVYTPYFAPACPR